MSERIVCPCCGGGEVSVARNMLSTRHCASCGHEWDPPPKPAALPLTEDRIRAIVREEIAKAMPTYVFNLTGTATNEEVRSAITAAMDSPTPRGFARHT